ncbi:MAG: MBL fold metallo-hydrolase [Cyanophyceae cyanobacterium]
MKQNFSKSDSQSPHFGWTFSSTNKPPQQIFETIYAFPPNRDTLGGTAYYIVEKGSGILLDCPLWSEENYHFLLAQGGVRWLLLSHRGGMAKVKHIQEAMQCEVVLQEQEAYLLPDIETTPFAQEINLTENIQGIWTPGHSPGSSCFYHRAHGGVLFTGRHLLPNQQGNPTPLRTAKTFHWFRQLRSVGWLRDRFTPQSLQYICPGANTGFLRGRGKIERAYERLIELDLEALREVSSPF